MESAVPSVGIHIRPGHPVYIYRYILYVVFVVGNLFGATIQKKQKVPVNIVLK